MQAAQPYPSQRSPVCASNMVATSQPLAAQAGIEALQRGGNAVDAALATAITLTVVEPSGNGLGSDAAALIWDGDQLVAINGYGKSPAGWTRDRFADRDTMPKFGWDSVTVPGAVSTWVALSARYGKLPFEQLFERAIQYASDGFMVGPRTAHLWQNQPDGFETNKGFEDHFYPAPAFGELATRRDMAPTLQAIAESKGEAFYRGAIAERIEAAALAEGGALRVDDLAQHSPMWVDPLTHPFRNVDVCEIPPNSQGLATLIGLGILDHLPVEDLDSVDAAHVQIEAMKIAIRAAADHIADADHMQITTDELLDTQSLARAAGSISRRASAAEPVSLPTSEDTVYLSTADANGMMVSFIQSNFVRFGAGIVVPGTGISMQNRGFGFSLAAGHPNEVGPSKRPFHTIIPGFITRAGQPYASFGVMGGQMQHQGHLQVATRLIDYGQNPQAASDARRWLIDRDFSVSVEPGFDESLAAGLSDRGHDLSFDDNDLLFGGAQIIVRTDDGYIGGSDHRKEGGAFGF